MELSEHLDDLVDEWHDLDDMYDHPSLHDYLGMTWNEYRSWTETCVIPQRLVDDWNGRNTS